MTAPIPGTAPAPDPAPTTGTPEPAGSTPPTGTPEPTPKPDEVKPAEPAAKTYTEDYVKRLRDEAAGHRTKGSEAAKERDEFKATLDAFRKALDPNAAPETDPLKVAEQAVRERDADRAELQTLRTERIAEKAARKAGADVDALLDSRGFTAALSKLDATSTTFEADITELVEASVKASPRLKVTATRTVTDSTGGTSQPGQLTREHLKSMSSDEIVQAKADGRLRALLGG